MAEEILKLSTKEPDRPFVLVDEVKHELAVAEDFGLRELKHLTMAGRHIQATVADLEKASEEDLAKVEQELDEFVTKVLPDADEALLKKLSFIQKSAIVGAFSKSVQAPAASTESEPKPETSRTGELSSLASSDSTEATPTGGGVPLYETSAPTS